MDTKGSLDPELFYDEEAFKSKVPYPLIPTSMKGVYTIPPPPEDLSTASADDLISYGLLWPGPIVAESPTMLEAWRRLYSRKWLAKNRVVPEFGEPQIGTTHHLRGHSPIKKVGDGSYLNAAWSGVGIDAGVWTGNNGIWIVPTVSEPSEPQGWDGGWRSSSWVGIDGYDYFVGSTDVLQAGVTQKVDAQGNASYYAWYEWFAPTQPNSPNYINEIPIASIPVIPGNNMFCSVYYVNRVAGYLFLGDMATGKHFSITLAPPPGATMAGNTVEWIMEAPGGGEPYTSLPKFTPVQFTFAQGWGSLEIPVGRYGHVVQDSYAYPLSGDTLNIESSSGKALTSVSVELESLTVDFIG